PPSPPRRAPSAAPVAVLERRRHRSDFHPRMTHAEVPATHSRRGRRRKVRLMTTTERPMAEVLPSDSLLEPITGKGRQPRIPPLLRAVALRLGWLVLLPCTDRTFCLIGYQGGEAGELQVPCADPDTAFAVITNLRRAGFSGHSESLAEEVDCPIEPPARTLRQSVLFAD